MEELKKSLEELSENCMVKFISMSLKLVELSKKVDNNYIENNNTILDIIKDFKDKIPDTSMFFQQMEKMQENFYYMTKEIIRINTRLDKLEKNIKKIDTNIKEEESKNDK
jgi:hypothetical protein